jgi:hypothetical protein
MAMPPNSTGENSLWWSQFHFQHGQGSEAERAFLGYLSTRNWHPFVLSAEQLDAAWSAFETFVATSQETR